MTTANTSQSRPGQCIKEHGIQNSALVQLLYSIRKVLILQNEYDATRVDCG